MTKYDNIPVLTDLIEKGARAEVTELDLDFGRDLIVDTAAQEQPHGDTGQFSFEADSGHPVHIDPALEQSIRRILEQHMEMALRKIMLAISQANDNKKAD